MTNDEWENELVDTTNAQRAGGTSEVEYFAECERLMREDPTAALPSIKAALNRFPQSSGFHYLLGNALRMGAQPDQAEASLRKAIALDPLHANASMSLAHLLREQGRMQALAEVVLALWRQQPRTLETDRRTLAFLCECERFVEADALTAAMLDAHPNDAFLLRRAGEIALILGRFEEAQRLLRATLAIDPDQASAWLRLAHTHRFSDTDDGDLQQLKAAAERTDFESDVRVSIGFALGKAFDDLGQFGDAARALSRANSVWHAEHPWDRLASQRFVDSQMRTAMPVSSNVSDPLIPVFVVGLPRSGTTLIETLLARDTQVRARGELNWIAALDRQLGSQASASMLTAAGNFYLRQLRQDDAIARFAVDKNPLNFRHLGLISAMLPHARIIHCRRDPRDNALSLWSQHFTHEELAWSYAFADIAEYMRGYTSLMAHWQRVLPRPMFELDYEALVGDTEATFARVREFLGLDTPSMNFSVGGTAIATASVWQARQKIHGNSVGRWHSYADFLPELGDPAFD